MKTSESLKRVAILGVSFLYSSCAPPERPSEVSATATWVGGANTGWWQVCEAPMANTIHCIIWNRAGLVLEDQLFLPVDGAPVRGSDLKKVRESGPCTGPYQVCLADGRILLPKSRFAEMKAFIQGAKP